MGLLQVTAIILGLPSLTLLLINIWRLLKHATHTRMNNEVETNTNLTITLQ